MSDLSGRLRQAVEFLKNNGYVKRDVEIARRLSVQTSIISESMSGKRTPTWDLLLKFCDNYPINFWWLRSGEGSMVKGDRELELLKRIEYLENRIRELEG